MQKPAPPAKTTSPAASVVPTVVKPKAPAVVVPRFDIHVMDPVQVGDGLKAYTAYTIQVQVRFFS